MLETQHSDTPKRSVGVYRSLYPYE